MSQQNLIDSQNQLKSRREAFEISVLQVITRPSLPFEQFWALNPENNLPYFAALVPHSKSINAFKGPGGRHLQHLEHLVHLKFPLVRFRIERHKNQAVAFVELKRNSETLHSSFVLDKSLFKELLRLHLMLLVWASCQHTVLPNLDEFVKHYQNGMYGSPKFLSNDPRDTQFSTPATDPDRGGSRYQGIRGGRSETDRALLPLSSRVSRNEAEGDSRGRSRHGSEKYRLERSASFDQGSHSNFSSGGSRKRGPEGSNEGSDKRRKR